MRISTAKLNMRMIVKMAILKNYLHVQKVLPFVVMFTTAFTFSTFAKSSEMQMLKAFGMSKFQILTPIIVTTLLFSLFIMFILNPIGASLIEKYERIEAVNLKGQTSIIALAKNGIWLRKTDHNSEHIFIIHALRVSQTDKKLFELLVFVYDKDYSFLERIESATALINEDSLNLSDVEIIDQNYNKTTQDIMNLPLSISFAQIQDSVTAPETISIFKLPGFISEIEAAGFSVIKHKLYLYKTLSMPLYFISMVILGLSFIHSNPRNKNYNKQLVKCAAGGLVVYFFVDILNAFAYAGSISIFATVAIPIIACFGIGYILLT